MPIFRGHFLQYRLNMVLLIVLKPSSVELAQSPPPISGIPPPPRPLAPDSAHHSHPPPRAPRRGEREGGGGGACVRGGGRPALPLDQPHICCIGDVFFVQTRGQYMLPTIGCFCCVHCLQTTPPKTKQSELVSGTFGHVLTVSGGPGFCSQIVSFQSRVAKCLLHRRSLSYLKTIPVIDNRRFLL